MKISVITVCLNSEKTIEKAIQSVLAQKHSDIEYIIVDGKSSDKTLAVIDKFKSGISKVVSEKDKGIYFALNKGIDLATGEVIGILHADDFYADQNVLTKVAKTFSETKCDSMYADLQYMKEDEKVFRNWKSGEYKEGLFLKGWMPPHPTFFIKKSCYEKFGKFNIDFVSAGDYELMLRMIHKNKISVAYLPEVIVKMRVGGKSNASLMNRIKANREDRLAWKINNLKPGILTLTFKPLSKLKQFFT